MKKKDKKALGFFLLVLLMLLAYVFSGFDFSVWSGSCRVLNERAIYPEQLGNNNYIHLEASCPSGTLVNECLVIRYNRHKDYATWQTDSPLGALQPGQTKTMPEFFADASHYNMVIVEENQCKIICSDGVERFPEQCPDATTTTTTFIPGTTTTTVIPTTTIPGTTTTTLYPRPPPTNIGGMLFAGLVGAMFIGVVWWLLKKR